MLEEKAQTINPSSLYSIGHGNKTIEKFIKELKQFDIEYLVDVRTTPFSKWNPQFNQDALKLILKKHDIGYIFLGDKIGGLPSDKSCYTEEGKIDYELVREKNFFQEGLERLVKANSKQIRIAMMCSETNPEECHRSKLIGKELLLKGIDTNHILNQDELKSQAKINNALFGLFAESDEFHLSSKKSYISDEN